MLSEAIPLHLTTRYLIEVSPQAKTGLLVLHGYSDKATSVRKRLLGTGPVQHVTVLTPNGLFPSPVRHAEGFKEAYSWYFRDPQTHLEMISPEVAVQGLFTLIEKTKLQHLQWIILGFSQCGFLAPHLIRAGLPTRAVIVVGAKARQEIYQEISAEIPIYGIHGEQDTIIPYAEAKASFEALSPRHSSVIFEGLPGVAHTLDDAGRSTVRNWIQKTADS